MDDSVFDCIKHSKDACFIFIYLLLTLYNEKDIIKKIIIIKK